MMFPNLKYFLLKLVQNIYICPNISFKATGLGWFLGDRSKGWRRERMSVPVYFGDEDYDKTLGRIFGHFFIEPLLYLQF